MDTSHTLRSPIYATVQAPALGSCTGWRQRSLPDKMKSGSATNVAENNSAIFSGRFARRVDASYNCKSYLDISHRGEPILFPEGFVTLNNVSRNTFVFLKVNELMAICLFKVFFEG